MERRLLEARLDALRTALQQLAEDLTPGQFQAAVLDRLVELETKVSPLDRAWFRAQSQGIVESARWMLRLQGRRPGLDPPSFTRPHATRLLDRKPHPRARHRGGHGDEARNPSRS